MKKFSEKKFELSTFSKVMVVIIAIVSVLMIVYSIMEHNGLRLANSSSVMGGVIVLALLFVWIIGSIARRRKKMMTKYLIIIGLGLVATVILSICSAYVEQYHSIFLARTFGTVRIEGKPWVILYQPDIGLLDDAEDAQRRVEVRAAERGEPEFSDDETVEAGIERSQGDYGYAYTVAPRWMKFFVNTNRQLDGIIYRGVESQAKILFEAEDGTAHFYLENAEPGDEGECSGSYR